MAVIVSATTCGIEFEIAGREAGYAQGVGNRIREIRLQRAKEYPQAFTRAAIAARIGVLERTIMDWELGKHRPSIRNARRLARFLQVSVDELGLDDPDGPPGGEGAGAELGP